MHTCIQTYALRIVHVYHTIFTCACIHTDICTYVYIYVCTHTHTHSYIWQSQDRPCVRWTTNSTRETVTFDLACMRYHEELNEFHFWCVYMCVCINSYMCVCMCVCRYVLRSILPVEEQVVRSCLGAGRAGKLIALQICACIHMSKLWFSVCMTSTSHEYSYMHI